MLEEFLVSEQSVSVHFVAIIVCFEHNVTKRL